MEHHIINLKSHLRACNYPNYIIEKGLHNARLQGPAPKLKNSDDTIPFVTSTNFANVSFTLIFQIVLKTTYIMPKMQN